MAERKRPSTPTSGVPWIARWFASGYLVSSGAYVRDLEGYADSLEAELDLRSRREEQGGQDRPEIRLEQRGTSWLDSALSGLPGFDNGVNRIQLDRTYWVCSEDDFNKVVASDPTDERRYAADRFDCDNFSFTFKARVGRQYGLNAVGVVIDWSSTHAYNVVVFADGSAKIFEPQTDLWPRLGAGNYKLQSGIVII